MFFFAAFNAHHIQSPFRSEAIGRKDRNFNGEGGGRGGLEKLSGEGREGGKESIATFPACNHGTQSYLIPHVCFQRKVARASKHNVRRHIFARY